MKKCLALLIALLLALSFSPTALAESTESYYIEEIGMSVSIPSDLYVITRDVQEGDPALAVTGTTRDGALTFMKESDIYLNAFCLESNYEIVIIMQKNSLSDFRDLPDSGLKVLMSGLRDEYTKYGLNVIESSVYDHPQAKFLQFYASQSSDGGEAYVNQYYTIRDGKAINLTLSHSAPTAGK